MAVQFDYLAKKGWKPKNPDENYVITLLKVELDDKAVKEEGCMLLSSTLMNKWLEYN